MSSSLVTRCETKVGVVKLVHPCASALHSHTQTQTDRQRQTQTYGQTKERQKQDKTDEGKKQSRNKTGQTRQTRNERQRNAFKTRETESVKARAVCAGGARGSQVRRVASETDNTQRQPRHSNPIRQKPSHLHDSSPRERRTRPLARTKRARPIPIPTGLLEPPKTTKTQRGSARRTLKHNTHQKCNDVLLTFAIVNKWNSKKKNIIPSGFPRRIQGTVGREGGREGGCAVLCCTVLCWGAGVLVCGAVRWGVVVVVLTAC